MQRLNAHDWQERTQEILSQATTAIRESKQKEVQDLEGQLPQVPIDTGTPISIALAGQYSAGKSTILKALTGRRDIATGAGITTETTRTFNWNGVNLIDTPGIHTQVRPEHDVTAYRAITGADLMLFVVTNELLDNCLAENFRKLAIGEDKGHEMILVVNKMNRAAAGNTQDSRAALTEDLKRPLHPFMPQDLRTTFTDAESYLQSLEENDPELQEALRQQANMEALVENLNDLIQKEGLNNRYTTPLYAIDRTMQEAMEAEPTGDDDVDSLVTIYNQNIRVLQETTQHTRRAIDNIIDEASAKVIRLGNECADRLHPEITQDEWTQETDNLESRCEETWQELIQRIQRHYETAIPDMQDRLDQIHDSHRFQTTFSNIRERSSRPNATTVLRIAREASGRLAQLGTKMSGPIGGTRLVNFSGTQAHDMVKTIGHKLGHAFQPWQAVKIARGVRNASAVLSVATIGLDIWMQRREDAEQGRRDLEFQAHRREIRFHANNTAREMEKEALNVSEEVITEFLTEPIEQMQQQVDQLNRERETRNEHLQHLASVSRQAIGLIAEIHREKATG